MLGRRHLLGTTAATIATTSLLERTRAWAQQQPFQPEPGATLRFLR